MRKVFIIVILFGLCFLFVGCNLNSNTDLYVNLKINYCQNIDTKTRLAVNEIEEKITGIVLVDYNCLNKEKIANLCMAILEKWDSGEEVIVSLIDSNSIEICVGRNNSFEVISKKIMLPV